jgi:hypothetical protein
MSSKLTYNQVIVEAILSLKERTGSSLAALKKAIASAHPDFNLQAVSNSSLLILINWFILLIN